MGVPCSFYQAQHPIGRQGQAWRSFGVPYFREAITILTREKYGFINKLAVNYNLSNQDERSAAPMDWDIEIIDLLYGY